MWIKIYVPFKFCVGYGLDNQGIDCDLIPGRDKSFFSFPQCQNWLWGPPSLLFTEYQDLFPFK